MKAKHMHYYLASVLGTGLIINYALAQPCVNQSGSTTDQLNSQCHDCVQHSDGTWAIRYDPGAEEEGIACNGKYWSDSVALDVRCGYFPQMVLNPDGAGGITVYEVNAQSWDTIGVCQSGYCNTVILLPPPSEPAPRIVWSGSPCSVIGG
jgi:hypothetical protein